MNGRVVDRSDRALEGTILNTTLGVVSHGRDGTSFAYQGGSVGKRTPDGCH